MSSPLAARESIPSTSPSPPSTPFQPIPLDTRPQPHDNSNMSSPSLGEETPSSSPLDTDSRRPSLTPADCRTLQKILHDVRSPSPMSTAPYFSDRKESPLATTDDCSRILDNRSPSRRENPLSSPADRSSTLETRPFRHKSFPDDDVRDSPLRAFMRSCETTGRSYVRPSPAFVPFSVAGERGEEYEDQDTSMELSDAGAEEEEMDGYRIEDWNAGEKAAIGDEQDVGYEDEDESMELSDTEGEQDEEKDGDTIEDIMNLPGKIAPPAPVQDSSAFYIHDQPTPDETKETRIKRGAIERDLVEQARQQEREAAAVVEQRDIQLSLFDGQGEEFSSVHVPGFQALQEEIGMHAIEDKEAVASILESLETYDTRPSPSHRTRRASEDTPLTLTSFINFPSPCAAGVVSTPGGRHIDFAPTSTIPETPFTKTLSYFKQYKGKENSLTKDSPSKRRRNASSPEEIAELAREAAVEEQEAQEEKELESLAKYRAMDLAPEEPVMESTSAGDLIMCGTPVRTSDGWFLGGKASEVGSLSTGSHLPEAWTSSTRQSDMYPSDSETEDWVKVQQPPTTPSPQKLTLPVEQEEDHDADVDESDVGSSPETKQLILYPRHPTFVTVIGMLPAAMFWATAAPVVKYGNRAFDVLVERLTRLKL